jgi:hypothetical protein
MLNLSLWAFALYKILLDFVLHKGLLSLKTGKIPEDWRYASVCPAFKKGDKNNPINYRPISLTCIICKLLEHVVTSSIMKHLEYDNIRHL